MLLLDDAQKHQKIRVATEDLSLLHQPEIVIIVLLEIEPAILMLRVPQGFLYQKIRILLEELELIFTRMELDSGMIEGNLEVQRIQLQMVCQTMRRGGRDQ